MGNSSSTESINTSSSDCCNGMCSPIGLKNFGNTCYMNAGLQFIAAMGIFTEENFGDIRINESSSEEVCKSLISVLIRLSKPSNSNMGNNSSLGNNNDDYLAPYKLYKQLKQLNPYLFNQKQQDAHEFIMYVLEIIHDGTLIACNSPKISNEELERLSKKNTRPGITFWNDYLMRNNSILNNSICGQFRSRITCQNCGSNSDTYDPFLDITLALPEKPDDNNNITIGSCFRKFFEQQQLFQDNDKPSYNCSNCRSVVNATRCINISQFPRIMLVTLKRFNNNGGKCNAIVKFKTAGIVLKSLTEIGHFKLVAVLQHNGSTLFQGHYISYVLKSETEKWYKIDDEVVTLVDDILDEEIQAYCLLYVLESKNTLSSNFDGKYKQNSENHICNKVDKAEMKTNINSGETYDNNEVNEKKRKKKKKQIKSKISDYKKKNDNVEIENNKKNDDKTKDNKICGNNSTSYYRENKVEKFNKKKNSYKNICFLPENKNSNEGNTNSTNINVVYAIKGNSGHSLNNKGLCLNKGNKEKLFQDNVNKLYDLDKEKHFQMNKKGENNLNVSEDGKLKTTCNYKPNSFCFNRLNMNNKGYSWKREWERLSKLYSGIIVEDKRFENTINDALITGELIFSISFNPSDPDFPFNRLKEYDFNEKINSDKYSLEIKITVPEGYPKNNIENLKMEFLNFDNISSILNKSFNELIISTKNNLYPIYDALKLFDRKIAYIVNVKLPSSDSLWERIIVNWTKDEQKHFEEALCYYKYIKNVDKKWSEIAKHVGNGRTVKQCIDRYKYCRSIVINNTNTFNDEKRKQSSEVTELNIDESCKNKLVNQTEKNNTVVKLNSYEYLVLVCDSFYSINTLIIAILRLQIYCERCNDINEFIPITIPGNQNFNFGENFNYHHNASGKDNSIYYDDSHDFNTNTKKEGDIITPNNIFDNLILGGSQNCKKCSIKHTIRFSPMICHIKNNRIGKIEFTNCYLRDIMPIDVLISCFNCNFYVKLRDFIIGKPYSINCRNCFKELNIRVDGINLGNEVFNIDKSTDFLFDELLNSKGKDRRKKDKDSKIPTSMGCPLPDNGTCSHYKKSNRWLRFPCCNKAYPCHNCHDKENPSHVSEWANNMICGFCSREQASSEICKYCKNNLVGNKGKAGGRFWEGGKGCRNALTLSNRDSRKKKLLARQIKSK